MDRFFEPVDAPWRGLGVIAASGLALRPEHAKWDAARRFDLEVPPAQDHPGCRCGEVLRGMLTPPECKLFATACTLQPGGALHGFQRGHLRGLVPLSPRGVAQPTQPRPRDVK